jgi:uncharacterized membrane protein YfcA
MAELYQTLILFAAGSTAGMINVLAGGGSSITLPILILMGLDGATANGTNRIAIFLQSVSAIWGFEQKKKNQFKTSFKIALFTLPGAVIGTITAITIPDAWFHNILAIVLIFVVISMFISPVSLGNQSHKHEAKKPWIIYLVMLAIGFYGGFIQVGIGFLLMASLFHILKLKLLEVNVHKVFIVLLYNIPSLLIFILSGHVHWRLGLSLAAGNAFGGWVAARMSVKKGDNFIRYALAVAIIILAIKMVY